MTDELCSVGQVIWGQSQFYLGTEVWLNTLLDKCFTGDLSLFVVSHI